MDSGLVAEEPRYAPAQVRLHGLPRGSCVLLLDGLFHRCVLVTHTGPAFALGPPRQAA